MALVKVYQPPGNQPCRVFHPNESARLGGESDVVFVARMAALAEAADSTLTGPGTLTATVDPATLPSSDRVRPNGRGQNSRAAWRLVAGVVSVDPARVVPR